MKACTLSEFLWATRNVICSREMSTSSIDRDNIHTARANKEDDDDRLMMSEIKLH